MFLVVFQAALRERRWYGTPTRGAVSIGAAAEGDVQLLGHNIAAHHVRLHFGPKDHIRVETRSPWGVRVDGKAPRAMQPFARTSLLEIGPWSLLLEAHTPSGIDAIDEAFLRATDPEARLVYADALEERGRLAEAELVRGPLPDDIASLAVRTPPTWRRRYLPIAIEGCAKPHCPGQWSALPNDKEESPPCRSCPECNHRVPLVATIGAAREIALRGRPVAIDPAVMRWDNDLREPAVKRPAIDMGQPSRRGSL